MSEEARRAAGILAQCKWLRDSISKWEGQAKEVIAQELSGGERTKAVASDGTEIGAVTRAEGGRSMQIDNEDGFLMWVKQRYPTEVVETVRPAFIKLCGEKVRVLGGLPDANGELCPHVSLAVGNPTATVKLNDDNRAVIEQMFMHRQMLSAMLQWPDLKAFEHVDNPIFTPTPEQRAEMAEYIDAKQPGLLDDLGIERVYTGHLDDTAQAAIDYARSVAAQLDDGTVPDGTVSDPEPFIEEGPPNWPESNTFEDRDWVHKRRG